LSREEVLKYLEVHFFSLALTAIGIFVVCVFLLFFFITREEYIYAAVVVALMVIALLGALELERFAKILKRQEKATTQKTQITPFVSAYVRFIL
jgi:cytochrome c biogenesis protein CcdA